MYIYILVLIVFSLLIILKKYIDNDIVNIMCFIVISFFLGFRKKGGLDFEAYRKYYETLDLKQFSGRFEKGYYYLNYIFRRLDLDYKTYILVLSVILMYFFVKILKKYNLNTPFMLYVYVSTYFIWDYFITIRQSIAATIYLFSLKYLEEKNFFKYTLIVLLASLFHKSAIILVPVYLVTKINIKKVNLKYMVVVLLIIDISFIFFKNFSIYILKTLNFRTVNEYINIINQNGSKIIFIESFIYCIILFVILNKNNTFLSKKIEIQIKIFCLYTIIMYISSKTILFARYGGYFRISYIIIVPLIYSLIKNKKIKIIYLFLVIFIYFIKYIRFLHRFDSGGLLPY